MTHFLLRYVRNSLIEWYSLNIIFSFILCLNFFRRRWKLWFAFSGFSSNLFALWPIGYFLFFPPLSLFPPDDESEEALNDIINNYPPWELLGISLKYHGIAPIAPPARAVCSGSSPPQHPTAALKPRAGCGTAQGGPLISFGDQNIKKLQSKKNTKTLEPTAWHSSLKLYFCDAITARIFDFQGGKQKRAINHA